MSINVIFNRSDLVDTGWDLSDSDGIVTAKHDLEEGTAVLALRDEGNKLSLPLPDITQVRVQLFLVLNETNTRHEIV